MPDLRLARRLLSRGAATVSLVTLASVTLMTLVVTLGPAEVEFTAVPEVELALPALDPEAAVRGLVARLEDRVTPSPAAPALLEASPFGNLPRVGPDGLTPLEAYARPFEAAERPQVGIVLVGLGLLHEVTRAAIALPGPVSLAFSPYAPDLEKLVEEARAAGHEFLLELPMEPIDYPVNDPGPHTLRAAAKRDENLARLRWTLSRAEGYIGVVGSGPPFSRSAQAPPVLRALAERGLGLIEIGSGDLAVAAHATGLAYARAAQPIDREPSAIAIDFALAALEEQALETGHALGVAQAYPLSIDRLRMWSETLATKGLVLAPVSAIMLRPGFQARSRSQGGGTDLDQS